MPFTTLISTAELADHLADPDWAIVDVRSSLTDHAIGERNYLAAHIPRAVYAHLERDLSSPQIVGKTGRHPLPPVEAIVQTLSQWGIDSRTQVVAYDDNSGVYAGRLWWMLRWLGHDAVAILDGDWRQWQREGRPTRPGVETRPPRSFTDHVRPELVVTAAERSTRVAVERGFASGERACRVDSSVTVGRMFRPRVEREVGAVEDITSVEPASCARGSGDATEEDIPAEASLSRGRAAVAPAS